MTAIAQKADHVRARMREGRAGNHHCHWPGCDKMVPPAQWGCTRHWYKLPRALRSRIWGAYRIGQEDSKTPSRAYVEVAQEVQKWIRDNGQA